MSPRVGVTLSGRYRLQRLIATGGMGQVWEAVDSRLGRRVAVKVLKRHGLTPAIRRQFVEEANTMAQLADHPYIVQVFRSEQTPDGGAYLVMKYYPPPNLAVRAKRERFGVEEVLRTGIQLASAVETAHRAGIVHPTDGLAGSVELAILGDTQLTERQKQSLLDVYASFLALNQGND